MLNPFLVANRGLLSASVSGRGCVKVLSCRCSNQHRRGKHAAARNPGMLTNRTFADVTYKQSPKNDVCVFTLPGATGVTDISASLSRRHSYGAVNNNSMKNYNPP